MRVGRSAGTNVSPIKWNCPAVPFDRKPRLRRKIMGKTLFDKIWDSHVIKDLGNGFVLLHIDRLLLHDLSGALALKDVVEKGDTPAQSRLIYATPDHAISTLPGRTDETFPPGAPLLRGLRENTAKFGIKLFDIGKDGNGIVHIVGPEQGLSIPGATLVCGDSH